MAKAEENRSQTSHVGPSAGEDQACGAEISCDQTHSLLEDPLVAEMVEHLELIGSVSPRELQARFELSRRTVSRRLKQLESAGLVVRFGNTRALRYRIATVTNRPCPEMAQRVACGHPNEKIKKENSHDHNRYDESSLVA